MSNRNITVCDNCGQEAEGHMPVGWRRLNIHDLISGVARQYDLCDTCTINVKLIDLTTRLALG